MMCPYKAGVLPGLFCVVKWLFSYRSFYRCRHHHRGHHSAESGSDRDSSYSREERRHHRSAAVICENEPYCFSNSVTSKLVSQNDVVLRQKIIE